MGGGKRIAIISRKSSNYCMSRQQESDGRAFLRQKKKPVFQTDGRTDRPADEYTYLPKSQANVLHTVSIKGI